MLKVRDKRGYGYEKVADRNVKLGENEYPLLVMRKEVFQAFLAADKYIDFSAANIQAKAAELFNGVSNDTQKARIAYEFVRDKISHSFDVGRAVITAPLKPRMC
jgi:hypothetical protein